MVSFIVKFRNTQSEKNSFAAISNPKRKPSTGSTTRFTIEKYLSQCSKVVFNINI
jgi:hypothetical protein